MNRAEYSSFSSVSHMKRNISSDRDIVEKTSATGKATVRKSEAFAPDALIILMKRELFPMILLA